MKRFLCFLAALCLGCLLLAGCKPSGMDGNSYKCGLEALEVAEQYLAGAVSTRQAGADMQALYDRVKGGDILVESYLLLLSYEINRQAFDPLRMEAIAEYKKDLAGVLGK